MMKNGNSRGGMKAPGGGLDSTAINALRGMGGGGGQVRGPGNPGLGPRPGGVEAPGFAGGGFRGRGAAGLPIPQGAPGGGMSFFGGGLQQPQGGTPPNGPAADPRRAAMMEMLGNVRRRPSMQGALAAAPMRPR